jgi:hypothetical protein
VYRFDIRAPLPPALLTALLRWLAEAADSGAACPVSIHTT